MPNKMRGKSKWSIRLNDSPNYQWKMNVEDDSCVTWITLDRMYPNSNDVHTQGVLVCASRSLTNWKDHLSYYFEAVEFQHNQLRRQYEII